MNSNSYEESFMSEFKINLESEVLYDMADFFKVFADPTRIKILITLYGGEISVKEIAQKLGMSHSAISHQLSYLRDKDLVRARRDGKNMVYDLADRHIKIIMETGLCHIKEKV